MSLAARAPAGRKARIVKAAPYKRSRPDEMRYHLENVPRELIARAKEKARLQDPPVSVKWVLIKLLEQWVSGRRSLG